MVEGQRHGEAVSVPLEKQGPVQADVKWRGGRLPGEMVVGGAGALDEIHG